VPFAQADTELRDHLTKDTTWTLANSPYLVNPIDRDLEVEEQVTLTIDPGVIVKFANGKALKIHGRLLATGLPAEPIIFTSVYDLSSITYDQPAPGDWYGININGNNSHLEYIQIKYAGKKDPRAYQDAALVLTGENHTVYHNLINDSDSACLYLFFAFANIQHNFFQNCAGDGISTNQGKSELSYNIIQYNQQNGIKLGSYANVRGNMILLNKQDGILVLESSNNPDIRGNYISLNTGAGITLKHTISSLKNNALTANEVGLLLDGAVGKIEVKNNDFIDNEVGMEIKEVVANNDLYRLIKATDNFWGDPNGPHDPSNDRRDYKDGLYNYNQYGDPVSDFIDYTPWTTEPHTNFTVNPIDFSGDENTFPLLNSVTPDQALADSYFADISSSAWYTYYVNYLYTRGVIRGYSDQTFRPNNPISRAELLKIVLLAQNIPLIETHESPFLDVPSEQWFTDYVHTAFHQGLISGFAGNFFAPHQTITRAEAIKIILTAAGFIEYQATSQHFADVPPHTWFYPYIEYAVSRGIINEDQFFRPNAPITRAEIAKIITILESK
jgi:parallel beta-helix repeat protein